MRIVRGKNLKFTPASHESPDDPGVLKRVLASRDDFPVGQIQMVNWAFIPVGKSFKRHYHEDMLEVFVICDGIVNVEVDGQQDQLVRGDAIIIEPREVHQMTNEGNEEAHYVVFGLSTGESGQTVVCE